jgi:hypothetical protein
MQSALFDRFQHRVSGIAQLSMSRPASGPGLQVSLRLALQPSVG